MMMYPQPCMLPTNRPMVEKNGAEGIERLDAPVTLIARAMNSLSVGEREKGYEDLHGVADQVAETPQLLEAKLKEFDQAMMSIEEKPAYELAIARDPAFVESERVKFLRCENYDPLRAAKRMVKFFQSKLELWGKERLHRRILLSDLDKDDRASLNSGSAQCLPSRDSAGRAVMFFFYRECHAQYKTPPNMLRAVWYRIMSALDDEETQRKGFIFVDYSMGAFTQARHFNPQLCIPVTRLTLSRIPCKLRGIHLCYEDPKIHKIASFFISKLGAASSITRLRLHHGSHTECKYQLMSFGIPIDVLPVSDDAERKVKNHLKWIRRQSIKEQANAMGKIFHGLELPGRNDVLLGRGRPSQIHPGNRRFLEFVAKYKPMYDSAPKGKKKGLSEKVLEDFLAASPSRFLRKDENGWYFDVLESPSARQEILDKVYEALRISKPVNGGIPSSTMTAQKEQELRDGRIIVSSKRTKF